MITHLDVIENLLEDYKDRICFCMEYVNIWILLFTNMVIMGGINHSPMEPACKRTKLFYNIIFSSKILV